VSGNRRVEQGHATRRELVSTATRLFAERGYESTSIEAVLEQTGVSRGALYHHFESKEALFDAVLMEMEAAIARDVAAAAGDLADDPVQMLRAGSLAWLRMAGDPVIQQIVLIDAPSVVGWQRWREIDEGNSFGLLKAALGAAAERGLVPTGSVDVLAHMLLAAMIEVALVIARAEDTAEATRAGEEALEELLGSLLG
jgi:AcrR family transcriptional regulator